MRSSVLIPVVAVFLAGAMPASAATPKALVQCAGCHQVDVARKKVVGPPLKGLYGKKPLKRSIKVAKWDEASLDRFLWNPAKVDPATRMFFKLRDEKKRAEVILALKALK